jgi:hypothetical protein
MYAVSPASDFPLLFVSALLIYKQTFWGETGYRYEAPHSFLCQ